MQKPLPSDLPSAPAAERNFEPILGVLRGEFADVRRVLEIGSGTGQHAAGFARELPWLDWQPTEVESQVPVVARWVGAMSLPNLKSPLELDVDASCPLDERYDGAFSANTAHIMSEASVARSFELLGACLEDGARYCLYGPFKEHGEFSTDSNERFDAHLRQIESAMGIRDIEALDAYARKAALERIRQYAMPGNNLIVVYEKRRESGETQR